jgi:hypothetical protein
VTNYSDLRDEIAAVINSHSAENGSDTPDWLLARYLMRCIEAFDEAVRAREKWYGRECGDGAAILGRKVTEPPRAT